MNRVPGEGFVADPSGLFIPSLITDLSLGKPQISGLVVPINSSKTFIMPEKNDIPDGIKQADRKPYYPWLGGEYTPATFNRIIAELGLKQLKETFGELNRYKYIAGNNSTGKSLLNIMISNESAGENPQLSEIHYPAESYNGLVDKLMLGQPKNTFGDQKKYKNKKNGAQIVLSLLNGDVTAGEYPLLVKEYYELIAAVNVRAPDISLKDRGLWDIISLMADHIMVQSNMDDLPMTDGLLDFSMRALEVGEMPEQMLDFLSHFDIPKELAGKILDRIDEHPNHPLYWWVASRCPEHPVVKLQAQAVATIKEASITCHPLDPRTLMPLGLLIENPDQYFPRTGIELETNLFVDGVLVPDGCALGTDRADKFSIIPELRLAHEQNPDVLSYGPHWLRRYFEIWRWEKIARGLSSSVHFHSEGNDENKLNSARRLFGTDYNDCRHNKGLGTIEVRTALSAYMGDGEGFHCLPHPSFVELLHSCGKNSSTLQDLLLSRVGYTEYAGRLVNTAKRRRNILEGLELGDINLMHEIVRYVGMLEPDMREIVVNKVLISNNPDLLLTLVHSMAGASEITLEHIVVDAVLSLGNTDILKSLVGALDTLDPALQERVVDAALATGDTKIMYVLIKSISSNTEPDLQKRIIDATEKASDANILRYLANHVAKLNPGLQTRVVDAVLKLDDNAILYYLVETIAGLDSSIQPRVVDAALATGDTSCSYMLVLNVGKLEPALQTRVVDAVLDSGDELSLQLSTLAGVINMIDPVLQTRVVDAVLDSGDEIHLGCLAGAVNMISPELQERVVDAVLKSENNKILERLSGAVGMISPELQERVVDAVLKSGTYYCIFNLTGVIGSITYELQPRVVDAALAIGDETMVAKLAEVSRNLSPSSKGELFSVLDPSYPEDNILLYNIGRR